MTSRDRLSAHRVSEMFVLDKTDYFVEVHLWPELQRLDPRGWLNNFRSDERSFANHLLNVFMFFNEAMEDALLRAAVQSLSVGISRGTTSLADAKSQWRAFLDDLVVTYVHGETPRATDSGHLFARKARQVLGIQDRQILEPAEAVERFIDKPGGALLLVDDFVGSGRQMDATWHRIYEGPSGRKGSLREIRASGTRVIYTPLVATSYGTSCLEEMCPGLEIRAAHEIDERYSLVSPDSILWPDFLKADAMEFMRNTSERAAIIPGCEFGWKGFHDLALAIAFGHGVPDATLPLFYWESPDWHPLIRRT